MYNFISRVRSLVNIFLILLLFLNITVLFSQSKDDPSEIKDQADLVFDSLITNLNESSVDTIRINILNEIAWHNAPINFKRCKKFADSALVISKKISWKKGEAFALKNLGEAFRYHGSLHKSLSYFEESLTIFQRLDDKNNIASLLSNIGISYYRLSNFLKAQKFYDQALNIFLKINNEIGIQKINVYLGVLYYSLHDYDKALNKYNFALKYAEKLDDESSKASILGNIGMIYYEKEDYTNAFSYYQDALELFKNLNDTYNYSIFLGNIANLYSKQKVYNKALEYNQLALSYYKKINSKFEIAVQQGNRGRIKFLMASDPSKSQNYSKKSTLLFSAEKNLKSSIKLLNELGYKERELFYSSTLVELYKNKGDYKSAVFTVERVHELRDSLYSNTIKQKFSELSAAQDLKLREKEIEILNIDNEYQKLVKKILIVFAVLLVLFSVFMFYLYKRKREHNNILEQNIRTIKEAENALKQNEIELNKHKNNLESLVGKRTSELEQEILERKRTEEDLLVAIERVEAANKAKSVFLENMSHELRTPLVGILGYSNLISKEAPHKELREMADGINRTGNRLLNTLSMVLDLARIESDKFEINIVKVDIEKELTDIYNNFKGAVATKNIDFTLNLSENAKFVNTDEGMFKVIIENLVNNAIKFTKEGKITIESKIDSDDLVVDVIDTGIGIKESEISNIFREFKQLSEGTLKDFQGSGLGLSISKKFVENLGGNLTVESKFGAGSNFKINIPLQ